MGVGVGFGKENQRMKIIDNKDDACIKKKKKYVVNAKRHGAAAS